MSRRLGVIPGRLSIVSAAGIPAPVPSVVHLIAMKLHALRSNVEHRERKDLDDVICSIERQELVIEDESFRDLCSGFGTPEIYERIRVSLAKRSDRHG